MTMLDAQNILSDISGMVSPFSRTHATPQTALATPAAQDDAALWDDACERMLAWRMNTDQFEPDDAPEIDILDTAIDFAVDERTRGGPVPTSIVPSGDGRVAFEWRYRGSTMVVEFVARGRARYTSFISGKVVAKGVLVRNPKSRKLELGG